MIVLCGCEEQSEHAEKPEKAGSKSELYLPMRTSDTLLTIPEKNPPNLPIIIKIRQVLSLLSLEKIT